MCVTIDRVLGYVLIPSCGNQLRLKGEILNFCLWRKLDPFLCVSSTCLWGSGGEVGAWEKIQRQTKKHQDYPLKVCALSLLGCLEKTPSGTRTDRIRARVTETKADVRDAELSFPYFLNSLLRLQIKICI